MHPPVPSAEAFAACACLGLNRAARGITRRYDAAFKPLGLTSGQFSLLAALMRPTPIPLGRLAEALGMDRTTLNRNIKPLEDGGLVLTVADAEDARVRALQLTQQGQRKLREAAPVWQRVQRDTESRVEAWPRLKTQLQSLA